MNSEEKFVKIIGIGSYLPERVLTNLDLSKMVDTSDEWIRTRTGIEERRIAAKNQSTSDLCVLAAQDAMKNAGLKPESIDLLLVGTITPDRLFPSTAAFVQKKLELKNIPCLDYNSACSGSQYGLELARALLTSSNKYKNILLICGDKLSAVTDWNDRSTCVLFGDGAGAMILSATSEEKENSIIDVIIGANCNNAELLTGTAGPGILNTGLPNSEQRFLEMSGRDVFREAVKTMGACSEEILKRNNLSPDDIAYIIPHQANLRIIEALQERLKVPNEKVCVTVRKYGNTSASSCIIALNEYVKSGKITKGSKILSVSFGAGLTWGAALLSF